jgi:rRNA maturation endonuclease Nob1
MAREVFVCLKCEKQGATKDGFCKDCGATQVRCLDDFARSKEQVVFKKKKIK